MDSIIRRLSILAITNQDQEFEIVEIGVEESVDVSSIIKNSLLSNVVLLGGGILSFNVV